MESSVAPDEGLRARKKRQTRAAIGDAAMKLFQRRGFDAVTIADIARAADVSEKTIFNYFPTKEHLVFREGGERREALVEAIRERAPGASVVAPFRAATLAWLDRLQHEPAESIVAVPRLVAGSASLRDRLLLGWEEESAVLAPVIAEQVGVADSELVPAVVARTLAWTHRLTFRAAVRRLLAGEDPAAVADDLRAQATSAYDLLEAGLAGFGVSPPAA